MNISIGIVAYNESASIGKMLHSLFQQSLFNKPISDTKIEIVVVPNGCTDDTAIVAKNTLKELITPSLHSNIEWRVCEVEEAGKSNAWNVYVHQLSNSAANYLFLMDSDIQLLDTQTLGSMLHILETMPEAWVAVDKPIKDVTIKENKNFMEQLSASVSGLSGSKAVEGGAAWICGQLYCARAEVLRKIWLPTKLSAEDSFVYTMIVTDGLKSPEEANRVILAPSASHVFEAHTSINHLLRHEKWLIHANTINELIYSDLLDDDNRHQDAGLWIKQRNEQDPLWLNKLIQNAIQKKGWWLIPKFTLIRRFKSLWQKPPHKAILFFPLAMTAFLVDLLLSFQANLELHQGSGMGYWGKQTQ
ncbi:MAG: glycosyltransferase [Symploca sp. SIO2D2]|nr:glycosyltransferase [Symploca sp. SIO2D2]